MHGLTDGNWKRSHNLTMATEENNPCGKPCGLSGSATLRLPKISSVLVSSSIPET